MKIITPSLLKYAAVITVLTILLRVFLTMGVEKDSLALIYTASVVYAVCMFVSGYFFGRRDVNDLPIADAGFRFHFTTYLVFNIVNEGWFMLGFNSPMESVRVAHVWVILWGAIVATHFFIYLFSRRKTIDSMDKASLFE